MRESSKTHPELRLSESAANRRVHDHSEEVGYKIDEEVEGEGEEESPINTRSAELLVPSRSRR